MIGFVFVWLILMMGLITNNPECFIIGGVIAVLNLLLTLNKSALEPTQHDTSKCPPHKWTQSLNKETYCEKCKRRPGEGIP